MSGPRRLDLRKATIGRLGQLYPACFYVARHQRRPLKIGIGRELLALDLGIGRRELGSALAWYVNGIGYLQGLRVGADRIGLDGVPAGVVSEADEARSREKLAALGVRRTNEGVAKSRPGSVRAEMVAPRRLPSPYQMAEAQLPVGKRPPLFEPPRKPEAVTPSRSGLAGLRAAVSTRKEALKMGKKSTDRSPGHKPSRRTNMSAKSPT